MNNDLQIQNIIKNYISKYGAGPHDLLGRQIKVGDICAVPLSIQSSANIAVIEVVDIKDMKIKGKNLIRYYHQVNKDKIITYSFPRSMIIINESYEAANA